MLQELLGAVVHGCQPLDDLGVVEVDGGLDGLGCSRHMSVRPVLRLDARSWVAAHRVGRRDAVARSRALRPCGPAGGADGPADRGLLPRRLREVVGDGQTGLLVPPDDEAAIAAAVATLLDDPVRATATGAAARRRAEKMFGWERFIDAHEAVYAAAADGSPTRKRPTAWEPGGWTSS